MSVRATSQSSNAESIVADDRSPMDTLPYWARATNPIVRPPFGPVLAHAAARI